MPVDPEAGALRRLLDDDDGGPVVMLNLLRYAGAEGRERYAEYARRVQPFLAGVGATVVYAGDCSTVLVPGAEAWDALLVVRYPSRAAFAQMVTDPAYHEVSAIRTAALEAAVLQATTPWAGA